MNLVDFKKFIYNKLTDITTAQVFNNVVPVDFNYSNPFVTYQIEGESAIYTMKELAGNEFNVTINYHSKNQTDLDDFYERLIDQFKNEDYIIRFNNSTELYNEDIQMHQLTCIYRSLV